MQLGFDLGGAGAGPQAPAFDGSSSFAASLREWQKGASKPSSAARLFAHPLETPLGTMVTVCDAAQVHLLEFADRAQLPAEVGKLANRLGTIAPGQTRITRDLGDQLAQYFAGSRRAFDLPLVLHGTEFTCAVWRALIAVPYGSTQSYGALASTLGKATATRAVARVNGANQIAIVIPCHRIIGADGTLTGYAGGLARKRALLDLEARALQLPQSP